MDRPHEYAPILWVEKKSANSVIELLNNSGRVNQGIQIVSFFAEWCPNCVYEATSVQSLYHKFHSHGLGMTLIMDYAPKQNSDQFVKGNNISIPFQYGELDIKDEKRRSETVFYQFRKSLGDERGWGVPTHLIIENESNKLGVILGEMIEHEINPYLNNKLSNL